MISGYSPCVRRVVVASLVAVASLGVAGTANAAVPKRIELSAPEAAVFGQKIVLRGRMIPPDRGARVRISLAGRVFTRATVGRFGGFRVKVRLRSGGPYRAGFGPTVSPRVFVRVRPRLEASLVGSRVVGEPLVLYAELRPRRAGSIRVEVFREGRRTLARTYRRDARVRLGTNSFAELRVRVRALTKEPGAPRPVVLAAKLIPPRLAYGSWGPAVAELKRRLAKLHYAVPGGSSTTFGAELLESVYAFQKVQGLARDGVVGPQTWRILDRPKIPSPRYTSPADHLEIDKTRQVLFVVRGGRIATIIPVSTAGIPGYSTPEGRFSIYRKVPGFDPSPLGTLYLPMYFTGGYAIHGNPSVPPYPASHGCIRVPMWIAGWLYETNGYGATVYLYS